MERIIAIPVGNNYLCQHFGHCKKFAVYTTKNKEVTGASYLVPPPHEPGVIPSWLASQGVTHVIAGGMGQRAVSLFNRQNITVFTGAEEQPSGTLVEDFLCDKLTTGVNACDH
jgi:predicted Fe-Mo cluster-binding NifX family protein